MDEETPWENWDWEEFRTILEIAPDALPCQLAVLCRKPCREVRYYLPWIVTLTEIRTGIYPQDGGHKRRGHCRQEGSTPKGGQEAEGHTTWPPCEIWLGGLRINHRPLPYI